MLSPTIHVRSIDPDPAHRGALHRAWTDCGWQADEAAELAPDLLQPAPDLLVLAAGVTESATESLLRQLTSHPATAAVPVLLLARADPGERIAAAVAGCLIWPTPPSVLRATARTIILARRRSPQAALTPRGALPADRATPAIRAADAEARLQLLGTAIDQAGESIVITDPLASILYVNPAFTRVTGYQPAEALGQNPRMLQSGYHDRAFYEQLWATLTAGEVWRGRFTNRKKDGTLYVEDATITPVRNSAGVIVNYVAVKRDVTHEIRLAEQVHQAQKMEAIGRLASGIAHDFNNLLAVINGHNDLLQDLLGASDGPLRESLGAIRQAGERGSALTRQLLAFARRQQLRRELLDLNVVVGEVVELLRRLLGPTIVILTRLEPTPGPIHADPGQISQVLLNLAINARDAMPGGGILTISTECVRPPQAAAATLRLTVCDTGCGMDATVKAHLFEPFFTTKGPEHGTGLGLATVYGIVTQSGGQIAVESEPGQGACFVLSFPCSCETAAP